MDKRYILYIVHEIEQIRLTTEKDFNYESDRLTELACNEVISTNITFLRDVAQVYKNHFPSYDIKDLV